MGRKQGELFVTLKVVFVIISLTEREKQLRFIPRIYRVNASFGRSPE